MNLIRFPLISIKTTKLGLSTTFYGAQYILLRMAGKFRYIFKSVTPLFSFIVFNTFSKIRFGILNCLQGKLILFSVRFA